MGVILSTQLANNGMQILKREKNHVQLIMGKKTLSPNGKNNFNRGLLRNICNLNPKKLLKIKLRKKPILYIVN
jgi:hypothetical protein